MTQTTQRFRNALLLLAARRAGISAEPGPLSPWTKSESDGWVRRLRLRANGGVSSATAPASASDEVRKRWFGVGRLRYRVSGLSASLPRFASRADHLADSMASVL